MTNRRRYRPESDVPEQYRVDTTPTNETNIQDLPRLRRGERTALGAALGAGAGAALGTGIRRATTEIADSENYFAANEPRSYGPMMQEIRTGSPAGQPTRPLTPYGRTPREERAVRAANVAAAALPVIGATVGGVIGRNAPERRERRRALIADERSFRDARRAERMENPEVRRDVRRANRRDRRDADKEIRRLRAEAGGSGRMTTGNGDNE